FALQVGLAALWEAWGIRPDAVVGHSLGEVAAAYVSGALSLEDAVQVVHHRSRLMQTTAGQGKMAVARLSPDEAAEVVAESGARVTVAAVNGPRSAVLAGAPGAIDEVLDGLRARGGAGPALAGRCAVHSPPMATPGAELVRA